MMFITGVYYNEQSNYCIIHIDDGNLAGFGVQHVHGTPQSRVKGADKPRYVDGILNVGHGHADEGFLKSAAHTGVVAGSAVPKGRGHDLIVVDLAVADLGEMHQRTARRLGEAEPFGILHHRHGERLLVGTHFLKEALDDVQHEVGFLGAGHVTAKQREGEVFAHVAEVLHVEAEIFLEQLLADGRNGLVVHPHTRQRADFHGLPVVQGGLHEAVRALLVHFEDILALGKGLARGGVGEPRELDVLGHPLHVEGHVLAVLIGSGLEHEFLALVVQREHAHAQRVAVALPERSEILVLAADEIHHGEVLFFDELADLLETGRVFDELFLRGDLSGAAGKDAVHVRHTAAEKRDHLMAHGAHFQRLDVLVDAHGVDGRGKAQIGLGVARHERGGVRPLDEILARQMVKMQDVRLEVVRTEDQVTGGAAVARNRGAAGFFQRDAGGGGMGGGAHAADALHDLGGVARMTPAQDGFETTVHAAGQFRIDDFAVFNHDLGLEMAFDTGHRIDGDRGFRLGSFCHKVAPQKRLERETPFRVSDKRNPGGLPPPGRKTA